MDLTPYKNITSDEFQLMLITSKSQIDEEDSNSIRRLVSGSTNWSLFLNTLKYHRLTPFVYDNLQNYRNLIPEEILFNLSKLNEHNILRMLLLSSELIRITNLLKDNGIHSVSLKGPVLSYQLYGNLTKRSSRDIDILIHPSGLHEAVEILLLNGYKPYSKTEFFSKTEFDIVKKIKHNLSYYNSEKHVLIELHWRLSFHNYFREGDYEIDHLSLEKVEVQSSEMNVLSTAWQLVYLAVHGSKHKWSSLYWLKDFNDFGLKFNRISEAILLAEKTKSGRSIYQALSLASIFYKFQTKDRTQAPKNLLKLALKEINRPAKQGIINDLLRIFYLMKLRRDLFYKIGCVTGLFYRFFMRSYLNIKGQRMKLKSG